MSATILNTDANVNAKTLSVLENDETRTGAITFDRDPNPPFVVTSGSANVPNLDADKLDGQHGSYYTDAANLTDIAGLPTTAVSWTPTFVNFTQGNGTVSSVANQIGKHIFYSLYIVLGSTSSVGSNPTFTLPVNLATGLSFYHKPNIVYYDSSANVAWTGLPVAISATVMALDYIPSLGGALAGISATTPFTWATNDVIAVDGWYLGV